MLSTRIVVVLFKAGENSSQIYSDVQKLPRAQATLSMHEPATPISTNGTRRKCVHRVHNPERLESTRYLPLLLRTQDKAHVRHK